MTVITENGKGLAASQRYDLALSRGALTLFRVLEWPPDAETAREGIRVSAASARITGDDRRCQELLEMIIKALQMLLAATYSHTERPSGVKLSPRKGTCIGVASERYGLTAREKQVLAEMADGKSNRQIAATLAVSVSTVKTHVSNILAKMSAESRTEAVALTLLQQSSSDSREEYCGANPQAGNRCRRSIFEARSQ